ncbi:conserved hypothetical protein [Deferribacter desulfuricans SSM1]|uniref:Gamma-glutamylcyclotransferase AIG2-like domain-containing protein n=1 Tax=Deferribacter desulfuricans (strain DSM 14783 / JCM 11476 / NBRC 101012 / SSM1) TaxID=639282 RepID=D3PD52_DEFDS|nr:gamma-glutamylcyclotransferase family protein [Deferribacter desulfuricans]BAI80525.1 conserved hypothetical protein [Deferribacter desulfuricans SSM1]
MYEYFFFYGTLRFGCPVSSIILKTAKYITTITLHGNLYLTEDKYPVFVPGSSGTVVGDIFEVPSNLITQLDDYEDINSQYSPYKRVKMIKNNITFWVYAANENFIKQLNKSKKIPSGDWIKFIKKHRHKLVEK